MWLSHEIYYKRILQGVPEKDHPIDRARSLGLVEGIRFVDKLAHAPEGEQVAILSTPEVMQTLNGTGRGWEERQQVTFPLVELFCKLPAHSQVGILGAVTDKDVYALLEDATGKQRDLIAKNISFADPETMAAVFSAPSVVSKLAEISTLPDIEGHGEHGWDKADKRGGVLFDALATLPEEARTKCLMGRWVMSRFLSSVGFERVSTMIDCLSIRNQARVLSSETNLRDLSLRNSEGTEKLVRKLPEDSVAALVETAGRRPLFNLGSGPR